MLPVRWRLLACLTALTLPALSGCASRDEPTTDPVVRGNAQAPAMCPWRDPEGDRARFFPGSSGFTQDTLILSASRLEILRRLGPGIPLLSNTLYAFRVRREGKVAGTILLRSARGEYGVIEVVLAVNPERKIIGLRLQRHREPPQIAAALTDIHWLQSFQGKSAKDSFQLGKDLRDVPEAARPSARAVAATVRSLLIEYEVVESRPAAS